MPARATILLLIPLGILAFLLLRWNNRSFDVSFNEEIRPLLNERCVQCHGGVKKQGGLSLLFRETALTELESGKRAIVPGKPGQSEMLKRIMTDDPELRMPPKGDPLTEEEIDLLSKWIDDGAPWETHWAFRNLENPAQPESESSWIRNGIDAFVWERLKAEELEPREEADRHTLIRRLSFDLTGLPPTPEAVQAFVNDQGPDAYEKLVDQLLASPQYGERWAGMWLDLARYADSKGYEKDHHREIWMYRDWLIKAFNEDMPYDQFTVEQLAGDLLPNPTADQYIATGFHRNTMNNNEGGVQNEEYRMAAVIDRVNTTWEVWNGISFGCAQCHDHPYDPFTQQEYYEYMDFFNNTKDEDTGDDAPYLKFYDEMAEEEIKAIRTWVTGLEDLPEANNAQWAVDLDRLLRITEPKVWSYTSEVISKTAQVGDDYLLEGRQGGVALFKDFPLYNTTRFLVNCRSVAPDSKVIVRLDKIDGEVIGTWALGAPGGKLEIFELAAVEGKRDIYLHFESPSAANRPNDQVGHILWILPHQALAAFDRPDGAARKQEFIRLLGKKGEQSPILLENPENFKRKTHVLDRGSWLTPTEEVAAKVPGSMPTQINEKQRNRLGTGPMDGGWNSSAHQPRHGKPTLGTTLWYRDRTYPGRFRHPGRTTFPPGIA